MSKPFISGLAWHTDDNSLRQKFEELGAVEENVVVKGRDTSRSRDFSVVRYGQVSVLPSHNATPIAYSAQAILPEYLSAEGYQNHPHRTRENSASASPLTNKSPPGSSSHGFESDTPLPRQGRSI